MEDLAGRLKLFIIQVLSVLIDSLFLGGWVLINWGTDTFVFASFPLRDPDKFVLNIVQIVFAVATFFPVVAYIAVDLTSVMLRARVSVQKLRTEIGSGHSSAAEGGQ
jgi:hypothetical protein